MKFLVIFFMFLALAGKNFDSFALDSSWLLKFSPFQGLATARLQRDDPCADVECDFTNGFQPDPRNGCACYNKGQETYKRRKALLGE